MAKDPEFLKAMCFWKEYLPKQEWGTGKAYERSIMKLVLETVGIPELALNNQEVNPFPGEGHTLPGKTVTKVD